MEDEAASLRRYRRRGDERPRADRAQLGAQVTGSDRAESDYMARLREAGIEPVIGHAADNVPPGAEVVYSTAVAGDNPERRRPPDASCTAPNCCRSSRR